LEYPEPKSKEPSYGNLDYIRRQQLQTLVEQFYLRAQQISHASGEEKWALLNHFVLECRELGYLVDQNAAAEAIWGMNHSLPSLFATLVLRSHASPELSTHRPDVNPVETAKKDFEEEPETVMTSSDIRPTTIDPRKTQASTFEMPSIHRIGIRKWFGIALGLVEFKFDHQNPPADKQKIRNAR